MATGLIPTYDDLMAEIGRVAPGFAGLYYDSDGRLMLQTTDLAESDAVRNAVLDRLDLIDPIAPRDNLQTTLVDYDFLTLFDWHQAALSVMGQHREMHFLDIDELQNRIAIRITTEQARGAIEAALVDAGVPLEAVVISVRDMAVAAHHDVKARPTVGGLPMRWSTGTVCTLGYNANYQGQRRFATNGHCSTTQNVVDSGPHYQPLRVTADLIGYETHEEPTHTNALNPSCPVGKVCKYTDLSLGIYDSTVTSSQGIVLDYPTSSFFVVDDYHLFAPLGVSLKKTGRTTHTTDADVSVVCSTVDVLNLATLQIHTFLCQQEAVGVPWTIDFGDSGSMAMRPLSSAPNVANVGQILARADTMTWIFSSVNNIHARFGAVATTIHGTY